MSLENRIDRLEKAATPPRNPLARLSDHKLRARTLAALPSTVELWRWGPDRERAGRLLCRLLGVGLPRETLERYPRLREYRGTLAGLLTPEELRALGGAE